jgi:DNA polymerase-3 subunit gamma/tau
MARVADQFSEEDLARFLQIILRTHSDLAYKQEQRFHLELGLLKLVHAQRLLPLEQLLSDSIPPPGSTTTPARAASPPRSEPPRTPAAAASRPSPFDADRTRKAAAPPAWESPRTPKAQVTTPAFSAGAAAAVETAREPEVAMVPSAAPVPASDAADVRGEVMRALEQANSRATVLGIEVRGADVLLQLDVPESLLEISLSNDARRAVTMAAGKAAGRPLKLKLAGKGNGNQAPLPRPQSAGPGARSRAVEDPVVRRMQEKFGAQIRTIIDYREKR